MVSRDEPTDMSLDRPILRQDPVLNHPPKERILLPQHRRTFLSGINSLDLQRRHKRLRPRRRIFLMQPHKRSVQFNQPCLRKDGRNLNQRTFDSVAHSAASNSSNFWKKSPAPASPEPRGMSLLPPCFSNSSSHRVGIFWNVAVQSEFPHPNTAKRTLLSWLLSSSIWRSQSTKRAALSAGSPAVA